MSFIASVFEADVGRDLIQVYLADVDIYISTYMVKLFV